MLKAVALVLFVALAAPAAHATLESAALRFYDLNGTPGVITVLGDDVLLKVLEDSKLEVFRRSILHLTEGGGALAALEKTHGAKFRGVGAGAKKKWVAAYHQAERDIEELLAKASGFRAKELAEKLGGAESDARVLFNPLDPKTPTALIFYGAVCIIGAAAGPAGPALTATTSDDTVIRAIYPPFSPSFCGRGRTVNVLAVYALECNPTAGTLRLTALGAGASSQSPAGRTGVTGKTAREVMAKFSKGQ